MIESKACNPAWVASPNGFIYCGPNAHMLSGTSIRKRLVMNSEIWERTSSHTGLSSAPGGAHVGERKLYAKSARTHAASIAI